MNSMSIATHCSMLINNGKLVEIDKKPPLLVDGEVTRVMSGQSANENIGERKDEVFFRQDGFLSNRNLVTPTVDVARNEIAFSTIFYVTREGLAEIRSGMPALAIQAQRAILMVDGFRTAADLSLRLRGGEAERILRDLEARNLVGRIGAGGSEYSDMTKLEKKLSAARLEEIKQTIVRDLRERLGRPADFVLNDVLATIGQCENALELRAALRNAGDVLVIELGEAGVMSHVRAIGKNVLELIAQED